MFTPMLGIILSKYCGVGFRERERESVLLVYRERPFSAQLTEAVSHPLR